MANKKLKVEVELETEKAKRKLGQMGDGAAASSSTPSSRSADKLAEATQLNTKQMLSMTRAFSGMAIGLAASYSSRYFTQGSTAEKILGYGGAALTGASAGAMMGAAAGPAGMAVGGLVGAGIAVGKEYLDRDAAAQKALEEFDKSESRRRDVIDQKQWLASVMSPDNGMDNTERFFSLNDMYGLLKSGEQEIIDEIRDFLTEGKFDRAENSSYELERNRSYMDAILSASKKLYEDGFLSHRASTSATDALSKIGGGFGLNPLGSGRTTVQIELTGEFAALLKDIRDNTGRKMTTWL